MDGLEIAEGVWLPWPALTERAVRSPGPGGQNVNKVETAAFPCVERITLHLGTPPTANTKPRPSHLLPVVIIDIRLCTE